MRILGAALALLALAVSTGDPPLKAVAARPEASATYQARATFDGPTASTGPLLAVWPEPQRWIHPSARAGSARYSAQIALLELASWASESASLLAIPPWEERRPRALERANTRAASARPPRPPSPGVEAWRPLVAAHFADVDLALRVLGCESRGDPWATNPSSGAAGLFQHIPRYWPERSAAAGWAGSDIYDPTANVAVAAWLAQTDGWQHWNPSRGCWG